MSLWEVIKSPAVNRCREFINAKESNIPQQFQDIQLVLEIFPSIPDSHKTST